MLITSDFLEYPGVLSLAVELANLGTVHDIFMLGYSPGMKELYFKAISMPTDELLEHVFQRLDTLVFKGLLEWYTYIPKEFTFWVGLAGEKLPQLYSNQIC